MACEAKMIQPGQTTQLKRKWTTEEEATLIAGVEKYGPGKWKAIKSDFEFGPLLASRSNVNMKDKWRNMNVHLVGEGSTGRRHTEPKVNTRGDLKRNEEGKVMAVEAASSRSIAPEDEILQKLLDVEEAAKEAEGVADVKVEVARAAEGVADCEASASEVMIEVARAAEAEGAADCEAPAVEVKVEAAAEGVAACEAEVGEVAEVQVEVARAPEAEDVAACEVEGADVLVEAATAADFVEFSLRKTSKEVCREFIQAVEKTEAEVGLLKNATNEAEASFARGESARTVAASAAEMERAQVARAIAAITEAEAREAAKKAGSLFELYFHLLGRGR